MSLEMGVMMRLIEFFNACQQIRADVGELDTTKNPILSKAVAKLNNDIFIVSGNADAVVSLLSKDVVDQVDK